MAVCVVYDLAVSALGSKTGASRAPERGAYTIDLQFAYCFDVELAATMFLRTNLAGQGEVLLLTMT
ncbi:hypothetical protein PC116_g11369 [Phytophthora cactorum]|nr:hypothetical protein PC116_g11369 [Phytophthora cactorum]